MTQSEGVPKPALGRGLADLLDGAPRVAMLEQSAQLITNPVVTRIDPGLRRGETGSQTSGFTHLPSDKRRILKGSLIAADALLSGQAMLFVYRHPASVSPGEMAFCLIAVSVGAWLACLAFWWDS